MERTAHSARFSGCFLRFRLWAAAHREHSGGHASRVRPNAALTSFAAWFSNALRAAEPGCFTCRGGRQAFGSPSPAQVSAAFGIHLVGVSTRERKGWYTGSRTVTCNCGMETELCMPCKRLSDSCPLSPVQKKRKCCSGSPVISGRHFPGLRVPQALWGGAVYRPHAIPVWVLVQARRLGTSEADLLRSYPTLRAEDLANAWAYARAHQEEIEQQILANETA